MVTLAREKLAGRDAVFLVGDAAAPPIGEQRFDTVLVRHVLWALPDPGRALRHWRRTAAAGRAARAGRGCVGDGRSRSAYPAERLTALLAPIAGQVRVERLSDDPQLWGGEVADERYAVVAVTG